MKPEHADYTGRPFDAEDLAPTWLEQFERWYAEARGAGPREPNAMVLATADAAGRPAARNVLLRGLDERGFVFYTNLRSAKARELDSNPAASLVFSWLDLHRQVRVAGRAVGVDGSESDAYWATRPREARVSALASHQSEVIASRAALHARWERAAAGSAPDMRPPFWGGFRVVPETVEFWQGQPHRLHDRLRYRRAGRTWTIERLAP